MLEKIAGPDKRLAACSLEACLLANCSSCSAWIMVKPSLTFVALLSAPYLSLLPQVTKMLVTLLSVWYNLLEIASNKV